MKAKQPFSSEHADNERCNRNDVQQQIMRSEGNNRKAQQNDVACHGVREHMAVRRIGHSIDQAGRGSQQQHGDNVFRVLR